MENNIREPQERQKETGIPCKGLTTKLHCTLQNRKIERSVRKRHQEITGEVGNLERTKYRTNKMRVKSKKPN